MLNVELRWRNEVSHYMNEIIGMRNEELWWQHFVLHCKDSSTALGMTDFCHLDRSGEIFFNEERGMRNEELRATYSHLIVMCRAAPSFYFLLSTF